MTTMHRARTARPTRLTFTRAQSFRCCCWARRAAIRAGRAGSPQHSSASDGSGHAVAQTGQTTERSTRCAMLAGSVCSSDRRPGRTAGGGRGGRSRSSGGRAAGCGTRTGRSSRLVPFRCLAFDQPLRLARGAPVAVRRRAVGLRAALVFGGVDKFGAHRGEVIESESAETAAASVGHRRASEHATAPAS